MNTGSSAQLLWVNGLNNESVAALSAGEKQNGMGPHLEERTPQGDNAVTGVNQELRMWAQRRTHLTLRLMEALEKYTEFPPKAVPARAPLPTTEHLMFINTKEYGLRQNCFLYLNGEGEIHVASSPMKLLHTNKIIMMYIVQSYVKIF